MSNFPAYQKHAFRAVRQESYLNNVKSERGLVGLMNNAKWVKLLHTLVARHALVKECQVKLIWEEKPTGRLLLIDEYTDYNFDYYDRAMEAMITGQPSGWYAYSEIEWLAFPHRATKTGEEQDIKSLQAALTCIGQLPLVLTTDTLRLDAYRKVAI